MQLALPQQTQPGSCAARPSLAHHHAQRCTPSHHLCLPPLAQPGPGPSSSSTQQHSTLRHTLHRRRRGLSCSSSHTALTAAYAPVSAPQMQQWHAEGTDRGVAEQAGTGTQGGHSNSDASSSLDPLDLEYSPTLDDPLEHSLAQQEDRQLSHRHAGPSSSSSSSRHSRPGAQHAAKTRKPRSGAAAWTQQPSTPKGPTLQQRHHTQHQPRRAHAQQQRQHAASSHQLDDRQLTKHLTTCGSLSQLQSLYQRHHQRFNPIHVSCAMNRLAWLAAPKNGARVQDAASVGAMLTPLEAKFVECLDKYTVREVANAVWSWAKLGHAPAAETKSAVLRCITANNGALLQGTNTRPQALANLAWGASQLQWRDRQLWNALAVSVRKGLRKQMGAETSTFSGAPTSSHVGSRLGTDTDFSTIDSSSSSNGGGGGGGADAGGSFGVTESQVEGLRASGLSRSNLSSDDLSGSSSSSRGSRTSSGGLQRQKQLHAGGLLYSPVDLSLIVWSFAHARMYHPALFDDVATCSMDLLADFCPQDLTNMLWTYAQVGHKAPQLFDACVPAIKSMVTGFTPQGLANLAWAYTKADMANADILGCISRQACRTFHALQPVHVAQLVWSMVRSSQVHGPLMQAAVAAAATGTQHFKSKELALVLWAAAVSGFGSDRENLTAIGSAFLRRMDPEQPGVSGSPTEQSKGPAPQSFSPQDMANIVYAYSKSGIYDAHLYETAARLCLQHRDTWLSSHETFRGIVWSIGHAGHYDHALFSVAAQHLQLLAQQGEVHMKVLACVLQPLAMMRHYDQECCEAVCAHVHKLVHQNSPEVTHETLANVLWSLVLLGHQDLPLMRASFAWVKQQWHQQQEREAGMRGSQGLAPFGGAVGIKQLMQYFQAYLWLQDLGKPEAQATSAVLPQSLLRQASQVWRMQAERHACVSEFQHELHQALASMGLRPSMERITDDSLFSVDMLVHLGGCRVAVEANGPFHYTATLPPRLLGNKMLRDNFLRARGYKVLNMPWWKWHSRMQAGGLKSATEYLWSEMLQAVGRESEAGRTLLGLKAKHKSRRSTA